MKQKNDRKMVYVNSKDGNKRIGIPDKQRALILQGGGALGSYEIGVLQSIYEHIFKNGGEEEANGIEGARSINREHDGTQFFDIIAGVSIGAINAAYLIDYFLNNNGSWSDSPAKLREFWTNFKANTFADSNPMFPLMWNSMRMFNNNTASLESARRYWSFYELACITPPFGGMSPNLCTSFFKFDYKYSSPINNCLLYNFQPLMHLISKNIKFPIKTYFERNQPRLLLISVDVKDCSTAVTFDSYPSYDTMCDICTKDLKENKLLVEHVNQEHINPLLENKDVDKEIIQKSFSIDNNDIKEDIKATKNHIWISVYGDEENEQRKHVVCYNGIDEDKLLASCLFPYSSYHPSLYDLVSKEKRTFWDGAFLNNTPLRELLQKHKDFWSSYFEENKINYDKEGLQEDQRDEKKIESKEQSDHVSILPKIPDLEVFIVDLYPPIEELDEQIPIDKDKIEDRMNDIKFHDRSKYDEKVAHIITDYISLTRKLIKLAKDTGKDSTEKINNILNKPGVSGKRNITEKRTLRNLLDDTFKVKVYRIERQDDSDSIFGKASDFTPTTIDSLYNSGKEDADGWFVKNREYLETPFQ
ncbi:MAG: patatin-like phospholipase family protein [Candidatus Nitrosocosmicus sp.]